MAQSRNEKLLEALLNGETADIVPQSRNEAYLKAMIEGSTEVAEPHSRIEAYLCALARKGGSSSGGGSSGGGGGGSAAVSPKEVNFYDYDGTCVHAYTVAEAQALSELPAGPEHPGLVFQGWNWSLEGVKGLTRAMNIGAMYTTDDGTTRLYITLQEGRTSPMLGVGVNGTVTVDWGDGTEPDVLTGTSVSTTVWTPNHAYTAPGDYVIRLTVDGDMSFCGENLSSAYSCVMRHASGTDHRNIAYQSSLTRVEIGRNVEKLERFAFQGCKSIESVVISNNVTSLGERAFQSNSSLKYVVIPDSVTTIGNYVFNSCPGLASVAFPESKCGIGSNAFEYCYTMGTVVIPYGVTAINAYVFRSCESLKSMVVPGSVTSIKRDAFCYCYGIRFCDFTACTAIPTLANTAAFDGIPADCEIRVPASLYDEWIAATNWATYADHIKAY